jgi:hypothetical protein
MIQLAVVSSLCLIVGILCFAVACILTLFAQIVASQGGATGFFILAVALLCILGGLLLCAGFT